MVGKFLVKNQGLRGHFQRFLSKIFKKSKNAAPPPGPDFGKFSPRLPSSCFSLFRARSGKTRAKKTLKSDGGVLKFRPWWPSPATSTTPAHTTAAHPPHRGASQTGGAGGGGGRGAGGPRCENETPISKISKFNCWEIFDQKPAAEGALSKVFFKNLQNIKKSKGRKATSGFEREFRGGVASGQLAHRGQQLAKMIDRSSIFDIDDKNM